MLLIRISTLGLKKISSFNGSVLPFGNVGGKKLGTQTYICCFKDPSIPTSSTSIKLAFEETRKDGDEFAFFSL
ncbi:hypothetical protein MKX01_024790, partial [Papaver californicum]